MNTFEQNEIDDIEAVDLQWLVDKQKELLVFGQTSFKIEHQGKGFIKQFNAEMDEKLNKLIKLAKQHNIELK